MCSVSFYQCWRQNIGLEQALIWLSSAYCYVIKITIYWFIALPCVFWHLCPAASVYLSDVEQHRSLLMWKRARFTLTRASSGTYCYSWRASRAVFPVPPLAQPSPCRAILNKYLCNVLWADQRKTLSFWGISCRVSIFSVFFQETHKKLKVISHMLIT